MALFTMALILSWGSVASSQTVDLEIGDLKDVNEPAAVTTSQPLSIALLWFANDATPEDEHWALGIKCMLGRKLSQLASVRLYSDSVPYGRVTLGLDPNEMLSSGQARKVGELIEARRVIWGRYQWENGQWKVTLYWLNVATGERSSAIEAVSEDWFEIRDELLESLLEQLDITLTPKEQVMLSQRETDSAEAWKWYVKATALQEEKGSLAEMESCFKKGLAADANAPFLYEGLAAVLGSQGDFVQAELMLDRALKLNPDPFIAYCLATRLFLFQEKPMEAVEMLSKAAAIDSDNPRVMMLWVGYYTILGKWTEAESHGKTMVSDYPMNPEAHAILGVIYANQGEREQAWLELKEAERLTGHKDLEDVNVEQMLFQAYWQLKELPLALKHGQVLVRLAQKQGTNPEMLEPYVQRIKAQLKPVYVEARKPAIYSEQKLQEELQQRLTPDELALAVNPLASSEEIEQWARELTADSQSDLDRAEGLYQALVQRNSPKRASEAHTAQQVYTDWNDPQVDFDCDDYAKLYVVMARAVGLDAFLVQVDKNYRGHFVNHACAIVFLEEKAVLVDLTYSWFGVDHQDYWVLDDLQAIALHLSQPIAGVDRLASCRIAAKLFPEDILIQFYLANILFEGSHLDEANALLDRLTQLLPGHWRILLSQGKMAFELNQLDIALNYCHQSLEQNPRSPESYYFLGCTLVRKRQLDEAREALRECIRYDRYEQYSEWARRAIVKIDERIGSSSLIDVD